MRRRGAKKDDSDRPPRPPNAFILFRTAYNNANYASEKRQQKSVSREASELWNTMTEVEKAPWKLKAIERKEQHKLRYPDYRYCPNRRRRKVKASRSRSPSVGPSNELPRKRRRRSPSLLPDTPATIPASAAVPPSSALRVPVHPVPDSSDNATTTPLARSRLSETQDVTNWSSSRADMLLQNAHVAEPSTSAVEEIRLPSVNLLHPPATSSVSRDAGPPPLVPSPLGLQDPPRLSRLAHTTAGQPLRNATSRLNATSQLLDHPPAFDFEWQFPYVPMVHALPAIEALESASDIQAFSYAQSYTAPLYPLETFPVEVSQSVYEAWMPEEQWSAAGVPSFSWGFFVDTPNEAGTTEEENPVIEAAHQDWRDEQQ